MDGQLCAIRQGDDRVSQYASAIPEWLSSVVVQQLIDAGLDPARVVAIVQATVTEDLAGGVDVTSVATVPADQVSTVDLVARQQGVVAGAAIAAAALEVVSQGRVSVDFLIAEGSAVQPGTVLVSATGPTRDLLTAERTALNLLGHLSGVASITRQWVDAIAGTGAAIRDTRKTTPGLRELEKFAVRCGGGRNHRMSLSDAALVKDNHVVAAGGVRQAFEAVRQQWPDLAIEVEVDSLEQLAEVLDAGADLVLLDNMDPAMTKQAVALTAGRATLESSGGLTLDRARAYAETGVDYLSVGALTHSAPVLDIGGDLRSPQSSTDPATARER
ncbi:MAG TPA: carboxylating nicotinate-nucleotide diphosphorylase [Actinobacteria bacterium]|nr:carboxylating nicotinate-nucleotide diphosphorylase [Actinomycetota bacterium]